MELVCFPDVLANHPYNLQYYQRDFGYPQYNDDVPINFGRRKEKVPEKLTEDNCELCKKKKKKKSLALFIKAKLNACSEVFNEADEKEDDKESNEKKKLDDSDCKNHKKE